MEGAREKKERKGMKRGWNAREWMGGGKGSQEEEKKKREKGKRKKANCYNFLRDIFKIGSW